MAYNLLSAKSLSYFKQMMIIIKAQLNDISV